MQFIIAVYKYSVFYTLYFGSLLRRGDCKAVSFGSHFYEKYHAGMKQNFMSVSHMSLRTVYT